MPTSLSHRPRWPRPAWLGAACLALAGCMLAPAAPEPPDAAAVVALRLIGEQRIAHRAVFEGTTVGGLSGIDYDRRTGLWTLISDDRSDLQPARLYTARLDYDPQGFTAAQLLSTTPLRDADGRTFPSRRERQAGGGRGEVVDTEAVRVDPQDGSLWYTSEGDRRLGLDPFVMHAAADGRAIARLPLPAMFKVDPTREFGVRDNDAFEGLTFSADGKTLWVSVEAPLYQDGPAPTATASGWLRFTQYSRAGAVLRQVAYPVGPVAGALPTDRAANNGVAEILALDATRLLVLERAGIQRADGHWHNVIRLYEADVAAASDVQAVPALAAARGVRPTSRRLVLDLADAGLARVDNIEGMACGPLLANGHRSLVLVSDDNFNPAQITQVLAFEVVPPARK